MLHGILIKSAWVRLVKQKINVCKLYYERKNSKNPNVHTYKYAHVCVYFVVLNDNGAKFFEEDNKSQLCSGPTELEGLGGPLLPPPWNFSYQVKWRFHKVLHQVKVLWWRHPQILLPSTSPVVIQEKAFHCSTWLQRCTNPNLRWIKIFLYCFFSILGSGY